MLASLTSNLHEYNNQSYRVLQSKPTSMTCNCHEYCLRCSRAVQVLFVSRASVLQWVWRCRAELSDIIGGGEVASLFLTLKKTDCLEHDDFLPFSKNEDWVVPEVRLLIFSFGIFSFASRQKKSITVTYEVTESFLIQILWKVFSYCNCWLLWSVVLIWCDNCSILEIPVKVFLCSFVRYVHQCSAWSRFL